MSKFEDENTPVTKEEIQQALRMNEADILKGLADKTHNEKENRTIQVKYGEGMFEFRVRPLSEKEWDKCRTANAKYARVKKLGNMRMPESTDTVGYHSSLIYTATVAEDRAKLWDNKRFWDACGALTGTDMVDTLIPYAGKKAAIVALIEELSGFADEEEFEETIKN